MSQSKSTLLILFISLCCLLGCYRKPDIVLPNGEKCFQGEAVKKVKDQRGMIVFFEQDSTYAVRAAIPGTYDAVDIGYLCEDKDILKQPGTQISFSGRYYKYTKDAPLTFVGFTYYYLDITEYKIID
jgi:hypothetical protein